jgi:hypothetical protein
LFAAERWFRRYCLGVAAVKHNSPGARAQTACGVLAGPLFVGAFTAIGAKRAGYDWRAHAVSSLACGREGWLQRANFVLTGVLYSCAARGIARCPRQSTGPRLIPALLGAAGAGLIGSGIFVTDPAGGFPPAAPGENGSSQGTDAAAWPSFEGSLHNLCAIPVFAGIPVAGLASALAAARRKDYGWACYSAVSSLSMAGNFLLFGAAFGERVPRLLRKGGIFQRMSIAAGFGWLSALSLRCLSSAPRP